MGCGDSCHPMASAATLSSAEAKSVQVEVLPKLRKYWTVQTSRDPTDRERGRRRHKQGPGRGSAPGGGDSQA